MAYQVIKRDGEKADFNIAKIAGAIQKAFEAQNRETHPNIIDFLALKVTADFRLGSAALNGTVIKNITNLPGGY